MYSVYGNKNDQSYYWLVIYGCLLRTPLVSHLIIMAKCLFSMCSFNVMNFSAQTWSRFRAKLKLKLKQSKVYTKHSPSKHVLWCLSFLHHHPCSLQTYCLYRGPSSFSFAYWCVWCIRGLTSKDILFEMPASSYKAAVFDVMGRRHEQLKKHKFQKKKIKAVIIG